MRISPANPRVPLDTLDSSRRTNAPEVIQPRHIARPNCKVRPRGGAAAYGSVSLAVEFREECARVEPDRVGEVEELDHIDSPLTLFDA